MRHKLQTAVFSQGWLESQIENMVTKSAEKSNEDPTTHLIVSAIQEQFTVVSETMDDLIAENADLNRRMTIIKGAVI